MVDRFTHINLVQEFSSMSSRLFGLQGSTTPSGSFWVLYLVEISNRLGYPISEEEALAAMYAALVHDLSVKTTCPAACMVRMPPDNIVICCGALPANLLKRCLTAVEWHGYSEDPALLIRLDAVERCRCPGSARLAPPGMLDGCDPTRLRLPVLHENTPCWMPA